MENMLEPRIRTTATSHNLTIKGIYRLFAYFAINLKQFTRGEALRAKSWRLMVPDHRIIPAQTSYRLEKALSHDVMMPNKLTVGNY